MGVQIQRFELTAEDKSAGAFDSMKRRIQELAASVGSLGGAFQLMAGGFSVGLFGKMIDDSIKAMDELHKLSIITGQSVESLSAMRSIAKQAGVEFDGVANGAAKLAKNMLEAARGNGKAGATFDELGLSVRDSSGQLKTSDQMMLEVAKSLAGMSNETQRVAYAQQLFGKAGAALLPFLMLLAELGLDNAKVTTKQTEEAHKFQVELVKLQSASRAWFMHLTSELLPALTQLLDLVVPAAKLLAVLFGTFVIAPALIGPAVMALKTLGAAISLTAEAFAAGKIMQGFAALNTMLYGTSIVAIATASAFGLLTVAVGGLIGFWAGYDLAGPWLSQFQVVKQTMIAFIDMTMKGWEYIKYGAQVAWLGVKTAFWEVIASMQNKLAAFFELFASGLSMLPGMSKPAAFINEVAASLRSAADHTGEFATAQAKLKSELDTNLATIDDITTAMSQDAMVQFVATDGLKARTHQVNIATKAQDEYQKILANAYKYLDQMEKETRQLGMDAAAKRADEVATLALDLRERDRIKFLTRATADLQAYIDKEDALRRIKTDREMLDADAKLLETAIKEGEEYGKTAAEITLLTVAKKEAQLATLNFVGATETEISALEASIGILRKVADQQAQLADRKAIDEAQRQIEAEAKKTVQTIDKDVHTGFTRMFDKLGGGWDGFLKSMTQSFKKLVADQIYMFFARPFVLQIIASTAGVLGLTSIASAATKEAGLASAATTAPAGVGGWLNVGSTLNSGYNAVTGGLSSAYTGFAQSGVGNSLGLSSYGGADAITGIGQNQITALGQTVGTGLSYIGAGMAGIAIGTAVAGDKIVLGMKGVVTSTIGAVIGAMVGGPIGAAIGGALGGVINAAFGMGSKQSGTTTLQGSFNPGGFSGAYATPWHQDGGWFRSDRSGTDYTAIAADQAAGFQALMSGTASVFQKLVTVSGDATRSLTGWTFAIDRQVSTEEEQKQLVLDVANSMGAYLIPELAALQAKGESLADTAVRLSDEFILTDKLAALLGKDVATAFGAVGLASMSARDNLVALMGGLQSMTTAVQFYYQNYFNDAERQANDLRSLTSQFAALNMAVPASKEAFRALVESLDLSTTAGQTTFAQLMQLAPAFDAVTKAAVSATAATTTLASQITAVQTAASKAVDEQIKVSQSAAQTARQTADSYRQITASLADAITKIRGGGKVAAGVNLQSVFSTAMTSNADALAGLPKAADDYLTASLATSRTAADFARDQAKVVGMLDQAAMVSTAMVNWNEYQATLLETQTGVLGAIKAQLELPNPDTSILTQQATLLSTIAGLLQEQTTQIVSGDGMQALLMQDQTGNIILANTLTTDQTGQVVLGNSWLSAQAGLLGAVNSMLSGQTAEIVGGNLILRDQSGLIISGNSILSDQAGKIALGNALAGAQTGQIITGNATQDAIKNISSLNTSYSEEMLKALVLAGTTQTDSLQGIFSASDLTVSLLRQLVDLTALKTAQDQAAAQAAAAAEQKAAADRVLQQQISQATAAFEAEKSVVGALRTARDTAVANLGVSQAPASYAQENLTTGTASGYEYFTYIVGQESLVGAAQQANAAYMAEVAKAYELYKAIPGHADGGVASGWSMVGERGPELVDFRTPGRVYTADQTRGMMSGAANDELVAEIRALRRQNGEMQMKMDAVSKNTLKIASTLIRVTRDGESLVTTLQ